MDVIVVGAGPCGILASIRMKELHSDYNVILVEKCDSIGKRIKQSGNGRCNFLNDNFSPSKYNHPEFIIGYDDELNILKHYLNKKGLYYYSDEEGRNYPYSENGNTILYILKELLNEYHVDVRTGFEVNRIVKENGKYSIISKDEKFLKGDKLVISIGGASFNYKKDDYERIIRSVTNEIIDFKPSLAPIITSSFSKSLEGKRVKANVKLLYKDKVLKEEKGEVLFKKDGLSGIVIFNMSSYLARLHLDSYNGYQIILDMLPYLSSEEVLWYKKKDPSLRNLLIEEIALEINKRKCSPKAFALDVIDLYDLKNSQVSSGGVSLKALNDDLSLIKDNNIYLGGETIDIDGECGGYNIEFALLSGIRIGSNI